MSYLNGLLLLVVVFILLFRQFDLILLPIKCSWPHRNDGGNSHPISNLWLEFRRRGTKSDQQGDSLNFGLCR